MVGICQPQSKDCGVLPTSVDIAVHIGEDVLQSQAFQRLQSHDVCGMGETAPDDSDAFTGYTVTAPSHSTPLADSTSGEPGAHTHSGRQW